MGCIDVDAMLDQIGHKKLLEWAAFCEIEKEEAEKERKKAEASRST